MATKPIQTGISAATEQHAAATVTLTGLSSEVGGQIHDAFQQLKSHLLPDQRLSFRTTTIQCVRSSLMHIQGLQAKRYRSMALSRMDSFLKAVKVLEKRLPVDFSKEFTAYILGITKFSLQVGW